jgi:uncharacterized iron-regulated membrane protein
MFNMKYLAYVQHIFGIAIAILLFMAGATGGILAFYYEIDEVLNPASYRVIPADRMLPPPVLIERLEQARPEVQVWYLQYPKRPDETAMLTAQPKPDSSGIYPSIQSDVFYINPYNAEIISERYWGRCCFERDNFLNFIYEVHHSLKDGVWGGYLMGLAAATLFINCLLVLWRCVFNSRSSATNSLFLIPTSNRVLAAGLALVLLPIAISSIAMNLAEEVFKPAVSVLSPVSPSIYEEYARKDRSDFGDRVLSYNDAYLLAQEFGADKNRPEPVAELFYSSSYNFYGMAFGYRDPDGLGNSWIYLDGVDGHLVGSRIPGTGTTGDSLFLAQLPIHSGRLAGLPGKIFIALTGLLLVVLAFRYIVVASKQLFRLIQE